MSKSEIIAIKREFPETIIIYCFFHIISRIIKHFPQIKSKNKNIKNLAKDVLANLELFLFIPKNELFEFFNKVKEKYESNFPKLFKYIKRTYFNTYPYKDLDWCYDINDINNDIDINTIFFTNNLLESTNRTININYVGISKSFYNFEHAIFELFKIFDTKKNYQNPTISTSRAIAYYLKNNRIYDLIDHQKLISIKNTYKEFMIKEKFPIIEKDFDSDEEILNIRTDNINFNNDYSSNYNTNSDESESDNNNLYIREKKDKNNSHDSSDPDSGNNRKNNIDKENKTNKVNKKKENKANQNYPKKNKNKNNKHGLLNLKTKTYLEDVNSFNIGNNLEYIYDYFCGISKYSKLFLFENRYIFDKNTYIDNLTAIKINNRKNFIFNEFLRKRFKLLNKQK